MRVSAGTIWVCIDCAALAVNGTPPEDVDPADPAPWALYENEKVDVTPGILFSEHESFCDRAKFGECHCEQIDYSTSRCDGCGVGYAGSREAFTVWEDIMV